MLGYVATHGTNPAMRNIPYDAVKDFTAICDGGRYAERAGGGSGVPAVSVKLVALAKVAAELRQCRQLADAPCWWSSSLVVDIQATHAPYRGIAPAITDGWAGRRNHDAGASRQRCSTSRAANCVRSRSPATSVTQFCLRCPPFDELGFSGFTAVQWYGIVGPAKNAARRGEQAQRRDQPRYRVAGAARATVKARRWSRCR